MLLPACHADLRDQPCDPYRTPRVAGPPVPRGEEKSAHAPYLTGDCWTCHLPPREGEPVEQAKLHPRAIRPVNEHCVSCHRELFRRPPRGHPPAQAFCASCHDPHASRQRALLLDEDRDHACLDYAPPYREPPKRRAATGSRTKR